MTGHVRRRGTTWAFVVDIGRDPSTGARKQRWRSGFRTRKAAERELAATLHQLDVGTYVESSRITVGAFLLDEWMPARRAQLRDSTFEGYLSLIRVHVIPRIGARRLQDVSPPMLNTLYGDLLATGGRRGRNQGGPLAPQTVRNVATVLHRALADGVRWGRLARNPADAADPPAQSRQGHRGSVWTAEEMSLFLGHVRADALFPFYLTAAMTGARRGELLGLTWRRLDLDGARLAIESTVVMVAGQPTVSAPKTARSRRTVALDAGTVMVLRDLRRAQAERRLLLGPAYRASDLVFCREDGEPIRPDTVGPRFKRLAKAAGVPSIRFHDLRHTHATLALRANVHPKVVSDRLGHASVAFTMDTYSASIPAMQAEAADTVAALIFGTTAAG